MATLPVSAAIQLPCAIGTAQRADISQVNAAIGQMDRVVQQNAALVDETSQWIEALHLQASALLRAMAQFGLEQDAAAMEQQMGLGVGSRAGA